MEIGVIADIHSNNTAFKACIDHMAEAGCREFILLGDYVSDTAGVRETMSMLYELAESYPCHMLRGNREGYMISQRKILSGQDRGQRWIRGSASGSLLFTYERLSDRDLDFFEALPITFLYEKEGYPAITCCHGSPVSDRELLQLDEPRVKEVLDGIESDYLLAAHTHYQGILKYKNKCYINTGASGIAIGDPGYAHAVILHGEKDEMTEGGKWIPELLRIPYDRDAAVRDIFESGLYDMAPWFMNNNLHTLMAGIDVTPQFVNLAKKLKEDESGEEVIWPHIEEEYFERAAKRLGIRDYSYLREAKN